MLNIFSKAGLIISVNYIRRAQIQIAYKPEGFLHSSDSVFFKEIRRLNQSVDFGTSDEHTLLDFLAVERGIAADITGILHTGRLTNRVDSAVLNDPGYVSSPTITL